MIIIRHQDKRTPKENEGRGAACEEKGAWEGYGRGGKAMFNRGTSRKKRKVNEKSGPSQEKRKAAKEKKRKGQ